MKKILKSIFCVMICLLSCFCLVACGDDVPEPAGTTRDDSKWFSQEELELKGLGELSQPTGCIGEISSSVSWFNNGYSFRQECPSEDVFTQNANTYFDYFSSKYASNFGITKLRAISEDNSKTWYKIKTDITLQDCYSTNPSKLYQWYYITDTTVDEDNNFDKDAVYSFEIRYEFDTSKDTYMFKLFIENASTNTYGNMRFYYSK